MTGARPAILYCGPQAEDAIGRILHEFRAEVCGRMAAVLVPIPHLLHIDDEVRAYAQRQAVGAFAQLERREMGRLG